MSKVNNTRKSTKRISKKAKLSPKKRATAFSTRRIVWKNLGPRQDYWGKKLAADVSVSIGPCGP